MNSTKVNKCLVLGLVIAFLTGAVLLIAPALVSARSWAEVVGGLGLIVIVLYVDARIVVKIKSILEG